jgi:hypothetical protein
VQNLHRCHLAKADRFLHNSAMPELDAQAIMDEVNAVAAVFTADWAKIGTWAAGKLIECGMNGGLASYTINGRTFQQDVQFFERLIETAKKQKAITSAPGGIVVGFGGFRRP